MFLTTIYMYIWLDLFNFFSNYLYLSVIFKVCDPYLYTFNVGLFFLTLCANATLFLPYYFLPFFLSLTHPDQCYPSVVLPLLLYLVYFCAIFPYNLFHQSVFNKEK